MSKPKTIANIEALKAAGKKFTCLTAYDASFSRLVSECGVDVILIGDSLGMVLQGHSTTVPVTIDEMAYHVACVARGNQGSLLIGDFSYMSYATPEQAYDSAAMLMQAGAHMVKLEGGQWLLETIQGLTARGIPVCAHLGLTPQSVDALGGFKVQGRDDRSAETIIADALAVEAAGARMLVLECVPRDLAKTITEKLTIPVMGIGAGPDTDGQVLVLQDMLGLTPRLPKFAKSFMKESDDGIKGAIEAYIDAVQKVKFPTDQYSFH